MPSNPADLIVDLTRTARANIYLISHDSPANPTAVLRPCVDLRDAKLFLSVFAPMPVACASMLSNAQVKALAT